MKNQVIHTNSPVNHLLCPMQCQLNGVHIIEVAKFLAESPSVTNHAIDLTEPFHAAHLLLIPLQLSRGGSCFYVYSPSIAEYENEDIPKIHLTAEKPLWDPSTNKYSEIKTQMIDNQGQISIPATAAKGAVYVSAVISY